MTSLPELDHALDLTTLDSTGDISIQTIEADSFIDPEPEINHHRIKLSFEPDPELCITPEKSSKTVHVKRHTVPDKHVHFDVPSSDSETSIENKENLQTVDNDEEVKSYQYDVKVTEPHDVKTEGPKVEHHLERYKNLREIPDNREIRPALLAMDMQGLLVEEEHIFQKPEMHSTLRVGLELKKVETEDKNLKPKVEDKLQSTAVQYEKLKKQEEALSSGDILVGKLTDLNVSESRVVVEKERDIRTRQPKPQTLESTRAQERTYAEPNIMECWTDSLETETYSSSVPVSSSVTPSLRPAQNYSVYDHLQSWGI